jgi:hypothetical protein
MEMIRRMVGRIMKRALIAGSGYILDADCPIKPITRDWGLIPIEVHNPERKPSPITDSQRKTFDFFRMTSQTGGYFLKSWFASAKIIRNPTDQVIKKARTRQLES